MNQKKTTVEPHAITRRDRPTLRWSVEEVAARRGEARADIINRKIYAPAGMTDIDRIVRAHELMHTKITPAETIEDWVNRGIASWESLQAVEEVRVNFGLEVAGFDLSCLTDGKEDADGELAVIQDDWQAAVRFAVASSGTAGGKRFLVGVRRQSKPWAIALKKIQAHYWDNVAGSYYGGKRKGVRYKKMPIFSTETDSATELSPQGFMWTEQWAEYLDRLGAQKPPAKTEPHKSKKKNDESEEGSEEEDSEETESTEIANDAGKEMKDTLRKMRPLDYDGRASGKWSDLLWGKTILSQVSKGTLGKKRIPMQYGRNPRRIGRLYTDPQRRVFDHERRQKGGIILVDGSGSMSLNRENVLSILRVAPGATVAIYSDMDCGEAKIPNIHIIAKNGKCVEEKNMPEFGRGNGVDLPALEWAIKQRKGKEPVIWVTDGGVCVANGGFSQVLAVQCLNVAKKNNVLCIDHIDSAVQALTAFGKGNRVKANYPQYFRQVLRQVGGTSTEQSEIK